MIALDQDMDAIDKVTKDQHDKVESGDLEIIHTNFSNLQGKFRPVL